MSSRGSRKESMVFKVTTRSLSDIIEEYDIIPSDNGEIFDPCEGMTFNNIRQWAIYIDSLDSDSTVFIKRQSKSGYNDDDY